MNSNMTFDETAASFPDDITTKEILVLMDKISRSGAHPCESCARTFVNRKKIKASGSKITEKGRSVLLYSKAQICSVLKEMNGTPASEVDTTLWMPKDEFMTRALNGEFARCSGDWERACLWIDRRKIRLIYNKWQARQQGTNFVNREDLSKYSVKSTVKQ